MPTLLLVDASLSTGRRLSPAAQSAAAALQARAASASAAAAAAATTTASGPADDDDGGSPPVTPPPAAGVAAAAAPPVRTPSAVAARAGPPLRRLDLATIIVRQIADHFQTRIPHEFLSLMSFSSVSRVVAEFCNLGYEPINFACEQLSPEDRSDLCSALRHAHAEVSEHFGPSTLCNIVLVLDAPLGRELLPELLPELPAATVKTSALVLGDRRELDAAAAALADLQDYCQSTQGKVVVVDIEQPVDGAVGGFLQQGFEPFNGTLQLGSLSSPVRLYPPPSSTARLPALPPTLAIKAFLPRQQMGSPVVAAQHLVVPPHTADDMLPLDRPDFRAMLFSLLKAEKLAAVVMLREDWYALLHCWHEDKLSNLMLSVCAPGAVIPWLGPFPALLSNLVTTERSTGSSGAGDESGEGASKTGSPAKAADADRDSRKRKREDGEDGGSDSAGDGASASAAAASAGGSTRWTTPYQETGTAGSLNRLPLETRHLQAQLKAIAKCTRNLVSRRREFFERLNRLAPLVLAFGMDDLRRDMAAFLLAEIERKRTKSGRESHVELLTDVHAQWMACTPEQASIRDNGVVLVRGDAAWGEGGDGAADGEGGDAAARSVPALVISAEHGKVPRAAKRPSAKRGIKREPSVEAATGGAASSAESSGSGKEKKARVSQDKTLGGAAKRSRMSQPSTESCAGAGADGEAEADVAVGADSAAPMVEAGERSKATGEPEAEGKVPVAELASPTRLTIKAPKTSADPADHHGNKAPPGDSESEVKTAIVELETPTKLTIKAVKKPAQKDKESKSSPAAAAPTAVVSAAVVSAAAPAAAQSAPTPASSAPAPAPAHPQAVSTYAPAVSAHAPTAAMGMVPASSMMQHAQQHPHPHMVYGHPAASGYLPVMQTSAGYQYVSMPGMPQGMMMAAPPGMVPVTGGMIPVSVSGYPAVSLAHVSHAQMMQQAQAQAQAQAMASQQHAQSTVSAQAAPQQQQQPLTQKPTPMDAGEIVIEEEEEEIIEEEDD